MLGVTFYLFILFKANADCYYAGCHCAEYSGVLYAVMVNVSVIWVKVVAPEKPLEVNTFPKILWCRLYCLRCLKISLCWFGHLQYPKILCVDLDHWSKSTKLLTSILNLRRSLSPLKFSPSLPNLQYLVLSFCVLCLIPHYVLPVLISHKNRMMFEYGYHWLIDNKHLRMHLLFHLDLKYNTMLINHYNHYPNM